MKSICFLLIFAILQTTTAVETSSAGEYMDGAIVKPRIHLFSGITDSMAFLEKIEKARYHLLELGNNIQAYSLTPPVFSQNGKSVQRYSWLFDRFNSESKGLRIVPVLTSGIHISYKLDF